MKKVPKKQSYELTNVHRWRLAAFLAQPGPVSTYATYLSRELHEKVRFTSEEIKKGGITEKQEGNQTFFNWKAQCPLCLLLDEDERLAVLEILLTKPREWLIGAGDDIINWLVRDREELKALLEKWEPREKGKEKVARDGTFN